MASDGTVMVSGRFLIGRPIEGLANSNQSALSQAKANSMNRENIPRGRTTSVRGDADMATCYVNRRVVRELLVRWTIFRPTGRQPRRTYKLGSKGPATSSLGEATRHGVCEHQLAHLADLY